MHKDRREGPGRHPCLSAHHADEADTVARGAAQVLRERQSAVPGGELACTRLAAQLEPAFVDHPEPAGPDPLAEALAPPIGGHGRRAVTALDPLDSVPPTPP